MGKFGFMTMSQLTNMHHICVSGNLGSGKSTTAKLIASELGFSYVPQRLSDPAYLSDFFTYPERWAFEVQTTLFAQKVIALRAALEEKPGLVEDRSLAEAVDVFAELYHRYGWMDTRAYYAFRQTVGLLAELASVPRVLVFCSCPAAECKTRIEQRGLREHEKLYPANHLLQLEALFTKWLNAFRLCPVFDIDTNEMDLRNPTTESQFRHDLHVMLALTENEKLRGSLSGINGPIELLAGLKCLSLRKPLP